MELHQGRVRLDSRKCSAPEGGVDGTGCRRWWSQPHTLEISSTQTTLSDMGLGFFFGAVWSQGLDFSDPCESFPIWVILRFYECFVYVHKKGLSICHSSVKLN